MEIRFLSCAEQELVEAVEWYNGQSPGLGFEFAAEVRKTLARIWDHPSAWPRLSARSRRCRVSRFPYGVIYQAKQDHILVVAVMHMSRHPRRWRDQV